MKVIGAGLPRTGTLTQKMALEMLGLGPCYHMVNVLADLDEADLWARALEGEQIWDEVFDGFQSTVDWPGGYFYEALAERYPEAKVVLSVRDKRRWAESMHETVWAVRNGDSLTRLLSDARAHIDPEWAAFLGMIDSLLWRGEGTFALAPESMEALIETAEAHEQKVRAAIPPSACWSGTCAKDGNRCAPSLSFRCRRSSCRTSTTAPSSSGGSPTARLPRCSSGEQPRRRRTARSRARSPRRSASRSPKDRRARLRPSPRRPEQEAAARAGDAHLAVRSILLARVAALCGLLRWPFDEQQDLWRVAGPLDELDVSRAGQVAPAGRFHQRRRSRDVLPHP